MEQLCDILQTVNINIVVDANPFCDCLHPNLKLDFRKLCVNDRKRWFKAVKCRMISNAAAEMTAKDVGLLAAGLTMINPKKFFDKMKDQMTGQEIEKLLLEMISELLGNCSFGIKKN